jgi:hypothetical protein
MRLLKIDASGDFNLDELNSGATQPYAILLHVWGKNDEEVTFRDLVDNTGKRKVGYDKIDLQSRFISFFRQARRSPKQHSVAKVQPLITQQPHVQIK